MSTNNTYFGLAALKASPVAEGTAFLVQDPVLADGPFFWTPGDFSGLADTNIVESDNAPLSAGAWVRPGSGALTFLRSGPDGIRRALGQKLEEIEVSLADYGVSPSASPAQNLARFKKAIAACPVGARLRLPSTAPGTVKLLTSGGASSMPVIDKRLHLVIDGDLEATHSLAGENASCLLVVSAEGTVISGTGSFIGDGHVRDINEPVPEGWFPCLVRSTAANFTCTGVTFAKIPQIGLHLNGGERAVVESCKFTGGPIAYGDTAHFGIRAVGVEGARFTGNRFYPDAAGGMMVQCILLSGGHGCVIDGNVATRPYEKLVYAFGSRNIAIANMILGNSHAIPGTNVHGTITAPIRFHGNFNKVQANHAYRCAGGAQMMDGTGHEVIDNQFLECGAAGISAYQGDLTGVKVRGNTVTRGALPGFVGGDGIRLVSTSAASHVEVSGNEVTGFSVQDPILHLPYRTANTFYGRNSIVKPKAGNGRYYIATTAGTSGGEEEPAWPTGVYPVQETVRDGGEHGVVWTTYAYEGGQAEIKLLGSSGAAPITDSALINNTTSQEVRRPRAWIRKTAYAACDRVSPTGAPTGYFYLTATDGVSGDVEPDWTGPSVSDGTIMWKAVPYESRFGIWTQYLTRSRCASNMTRASERGLVEQEGGHNRWEFNDVKGAANTAVQTMAATSVNLNYAEGSGLLGEGEDLVVTGGFIGEYSYERVGRTVHLRGTLTAGTGLKMPVAGVATDLPVTPSKNATGTAWNTYLTKTGTVQVLASANALYLSAMDDPGVGFSTIVFQISYPTAA